MNKDKHSEKNLEKQIVKILRESYLEMKEIENFDAESFPFYLLRTAMIELIQWHDPDYVQSIIENFYQRSRNFGHLPEKSNQEDKVDEVEANTILL